MWDILGDWRLQKNNSDSNGFCGLKRNDSQMAQVCMTYLIKNFSRRDHNMALLLKS